MWISLCEVRSAQREQLRFADRTSDTSSSVAVSSALSAESIMVDKSASRSNGGARMALAALQLELELESRSSDSDLEAL